MQIKRLRRMTDAELEAECDERAGKILDARAAVRRWEKMLTRAQVEQSRRRRSKAES